MLAYSPTEYVGELYHIQLSCTEDTNDYIFVVWGTTNVTKCKYRVSHNMTLCNNDIVFCTIFAAKFNCTIPGTLYTHSIDCPSPQTTNNERGPSKGSGDDHNNYRDQ